MTCGDTQIEASSVRVAMRKLRERTHTAGSGYQQQFSVRAGGSEGVCVCSAYRNWCWVVYCTAGAVVDTSACHYDYAADLGEGES